MKFCNIKLGWSLHLSLSADPKVSMEEKSENIWSVSLSFSVCDTRMFTLIGTVEEKGLTFLPVQYFWLPFFRESVKAKIFFSDNGTYPEVHLQCECSVSDSPLFFFFALLVHGQLQCLSSFSPFWVSAQKHDLTTEKTPEFVMMSLLWWCSRVFAFLGFEREIVYFLFSPSLKWVLWGLEEVAESGQWWWGQREDDWKRVERVEEGSWREKGFSHF